jgi:hypothetical protein
MDMAVARKQQIREEAPAPKRPRPRRVRETDVFSESPNPIAEQIIRLEDAFSSEDAAPRYPGKVRLAIMIGAPAALWAVIAWAALGLRALF